jgi:hypothetical protein
MPRFLVETKHSGDNCLMVLGEIRSMGFLHHFEWGCDVDVHCGWTFLEAKDEEEALLSVPLIVRSQARAIRMVRFSEDDFERLHIEHRKSNT